MAVGLFLLWKRAEAGELQQAGPWRDEGLVQLKISGSHLQRSQPRCALEAALTHNLSRPDLKSGAPVMQSGGWLMARPRQEDWRSRSTKRLGW